MRYDRPGPGVSKDEKKPPAPILFFQIYFRKFWYLVRLNLLYVASCILFYVPVLFAFFGRELGSWYFYVSVFPVLLTGPFTAGFVYELRDFARERPSFIWGDFISVARKNWKQSMAAAAIGVIGFDLFFYLFQVCSALTGTQSLFYIPLTMLCVFGLFFLFMQYYVFLVIVTFEMKLKDIYRNSLIFAFIGIGRNVFVTVVSSLLLLVTVLLYVPLAFLFPFITVGTIGFLIVFSVWPLVKKHMIDPYAGQPPEQDKGDALFTDRGEEL